MQNQSKREITFDSQLKNIKVGTANKSYGRLGAGKQEPLSSYSFCCQTKITTREECPKFITKNIIAHLITAVFKTLYKI